MRVGEMTTDNSQRRGLSCSQCCSSPREKKDEGQGRKVSTGGMQEKNRTLEWFSSIRDKGRTLHFKRVLIWERIATVSVIFLLTLLPLCKLASVQKREGGGLSKCLIVHPFTHQFHHLSSSSPPANPASAQPRTRASESVPPREQRCGRRSRCAGRNVWGRPATRGSGQTASFHTGGGSSRMHGAWTAEAEETEARKHMNTWISTKQFIQPSHISTFTHLFSFSPEGFFCPVTLLFGGQGYLIIKV